MFWKRRTYLDNAAGVSANPSSPHEEGRRAKKMLEDSRIDIARLLEVQSDDVIFTSGSTEANALAILGIAKAGDHVLYLPSAHASVVENMKLLAERGVEVDVLPITNWRVDCEKLKKLLKPNTKLVAMDAVCGETGVIWNTREVANVLFETGKQFSCSLGAKQPLAEKITFPFRALLHVDSSQAPMTEKITRAHFGADMLTLDASKVGPPAGGRGIGMLIAHRTIPLIPLYGGGGQERGLRSGSEAPELAQMFAAALRAAALGREAFVARAKHARLGLVKTISLSVPNVFINEGPPAVGQAPHILNISLPGRDTDYLVALLDEAGFAVSSRSACETDSTEGSRAVLALTGDPERAKTTLRISWRPGIGDAGLSGFVKALADAVTFIDNASER